MTPKKHNVCLLLLVLFLPLLLACPYESGVPLSKSIKAKIDTELLGEWENTKRGEPAIIIQQFNDNELLFLGREDGNVQPEGLRAFTTVVKGERFLNVQEIKISGKGQGWYIVHYTILGETLTARIVDDKLIAKPFATSKALYAFVKKNLCNKELFGDDPAMVFQRVRSKDGGAKK